MNNSNLRTNNYQKNKDLILPKYIHDDKNELNYTLHGDYYYLDLIFPKRGPHSIRKWGRMHEHYMIKHKPVLYSQLMLQGNPHTYQADLNEQATVRLEMLVWSMPLKEGMDEKNENQKSNDLAQENEQHSTSGRRK